MVIAAPDFPAPPGASTGLLGDEMVVNGIPMHIRQFSSRREPHRVLEFYRHYWPQGTEEKPGYTETDALRPWQIITRVEDGYLMTVQVTGVDGGGSRGFLAMSELPDLEENMPKPGADFPKLNSSTVINDIESEDIGKQGRTLQLFNRYSVETNANYYRDHYTNQGWVADVDRAMSGGDLHTQRFSRGNKNVIITINKARHGSIIIAQTEQQEW